MKLTNAIILLLTVSACAKAPTLDERTELKEQVAQLQASIDSMHEYIGKLESAKEPQTKKEFFTQDGYALQNTALDLVNDHAPKDMGAYDYCLTLTEQAPIDFVYAQSHHIEHKQPIYFKDALNGKLDPNLQSACALVLFGPEF